MRRVLSILLMLSFVLQSAWGMEVWHCPGEPGRVAHCSSSDFGEAVTPMDSDTALEISDTDPSKAGSPQEHGHHHCSVWCVLPQDADERLVAMKPSLHPSFFPAHFSSALPDRIERPKWVVAP